MTFLWKVFRPTRIGLASLLFSFLLFALPGCHSPYVQATLENRGDTALHLVEVDYPSASFGAAQIPAHKSFHYRFKIQGSGPIQMHFTDAHGKAISSQGPDLSEGQEGSILVTVTGLGHVSWLPSLTRAR